MPKKPDEMLRSYCLGGQRLRVSKATYGKPGKCVACRLKIRIPTEDEIPTDTKVIHLKDHPEFLRKKPLPNEPEPVEEMSPPADFDFEVPSTIALDILEPVQTLTSLALKFHRRINALEDSPKTETQRSALVAAQKRVQVARSLLNERLEERLDETTAELKSINAKIDQRAEKAQDGDITIFEYRDTIDMLRRQREHLERLQHNLRGWIAARNPDMAGGYVNIPSKTVPDASLPQRLPGTFENRQPLVAQHVGALRDALARRERAERLMREAEKNASSTQSTPPTSDDTLSEHEVAKYRAEAEISFRRARLNKLAEDCSSDLQIIQTCLERERLHFNSGMIKKGGFKAVESALIEVQRNTEEMHQTISRALIASVSNDVPQIEPELLKRLPYLPVAGGLFKDPDAWIAWGSALAWGLSVFLPIVQGSSLLSLFRDSAIAGRPLPYSTALPVLIGLIITVVALLPRPLWRGIGFSGLWTLFTLGGLWLLHDALGSTSMEAFQRSGPWYFRPAIDMMILGDIGLLAAAVFSLLTTQKSRLVHTVSGSLVAIGIILFAIIPTTNTPKTNLETRVANISAPQVQPVPQPVASVPAPAVTAEVPLPPPDPPAVEDPKPASTDANVIILLRGVGSGDGTNPMRFMFRIQTPDAGEQNLNVVLGETVFGDWKVTEYNPKLNTMTLSNGEKLRILHVGEPQSLAD